MQSVQLFIKATMHSKTFYIKNIVTIYFKITYKVRFTQSILDTFQYFWMSFLNTAHHENDYPGIHYLESRAHPQTTFSSQFQLHGFQDSLTTDVLLSWAVGGIFCLIIRILLAAYGLCLLINQSGLSWLPHLQLGKPPLWNEWHAK